MSKPFQLSMAMLTILIILVIAQRRRCREKIVFQLCNGKGKKKCFDYCDMRDCAAACKKKRNGEGICDGNEFALSAQCFCLYKC
ncbi:hypothetical protein ISN45_Aa06g031290 [Arabidopsis thaliana x Arabidopsis arenosa]|uniref:Uncharacterized protein n=1 Tax=Arabidopsis thaliana x Arabidopsis arenosa TaxID=1240361 RepID=A0A8T1Z120_9BRAS|nr:hypothetical protein ISN45_Aa06g031290 [Arabidopsis thaliana x Arabidopsis arenosa]